jgi:hypothetical protein
MVITQIFSLNSGPRRNGLETIHFVFRDCKYQRKAGEPGVKANGYQS